MKKILLLLFCYCLNFSFAQVRECGVDENEPYEAEVQRQQTIAALKAAPGFYLPSLVYVAIKIHNFGTTEGGGYLSQGAINNALAKLNKEFKPANIEFYFSGSTFSNYPDSYIYTGLQTETEKSTFHSTYGANNAINIYLQQLVVNSAGNTVGGYAYVGPTSQPFNRIYIKAVQMDDMSTAVHEVGHYFTLRHTFHNATSTTITNRELVTRNANEIPPRLSANCVTGGDYLCDTHADPYGVGNGNATVGCNYAGTVTDANSDQFTPQIKNFMSYHMSCSPFVFTPGQYDRISNGYITVTNPANNFTLNAPETSQAAPSNVTASISGSTITVSWTDNSTLETGYIVENALAPAGPFTALKGVGPNVTSITTPVISGSTQYFRVKPSNSKNNYSASPLAVQEAFAGGMLQVFPNPATSSISISSGETTVFDSVEIINMAGQVVSREAASNGTVDVSSLATGLYLLRAQTGDSRYHGKFIRQ